MKRERGKVKKGVDNNKEGKKKEGKKKKIKETREAKYAIVARSRNYCCTGNNNALCVVFLLFFSYMSLQTVQKY